MSCERGQFSTEMEQSRIVNGIGFSENVPVCEACPLETYADKLGSVECLPCPKYHTTLSTGATSVEECLREYTSVCHGMVVKIHVCELYPCAYIYLFDFQHYLCCWNVSLATLVLMSLSTVRLTEHLRTYSAPSTMDFNTNVCKSIAHVLKLY